MSGKKSCRATRCNRLGLGEKEDSYLSKALQA